MKKTLLVLLAGLILLATSAFAQGEVDCKAEIFACQAIDPERGDHQPAIHFTVATAGIVHLHAGLWDGTTCKGAPDAEAEGDLDLPTGERNVRVIFPEPLPEGTVLSAVWALGTCPETDCLTYTIGSDPDLCPLLAGAMSDDYMVSQ